MEHLSRTVCRACRQQLLSQTKGRPFSISAASLIASPESPHYVDVPPSHQPELPWTPKQKGTLPVPRELFPEKRPDKPSKQYLDNVTRDPIAHNVIPEAQLSSVGKRKVRMAELRKQHLREGLMELYKRKKTDINRMQLRSHAKQSERSRLIEQAEREDARLTGVSTTKEMRPDAQSNLEAIKAETEAAKRIHAQKTANYQRTQAAKHEERMDNLHTLYMNARNFITTEEQLNRAIVEAFDTDPESDRTLRRTMHADFQTSIKSGESMWNFGPPDSIKDLIADASNRPRLADQLKMISGFGSAALAKTYKNNDAMAEARFEKDQQRMKKIAEKLSGGKI